MTPNPVTLWGIVLHQPQGRLGWSNVWSEAKDLGDLLSIHHLMVFLFTVYHSTQFATYVAWPAPTTAVRSTLSLPLCPSWILQISFGSPGFIRFEIRPCVPQPQTKGPGYMTDASRLLLPTDVWTILTPPYTVQYGVLRSCTVYGSPPATLSQWSDYSSQLNYSRSEAPQDEGYPECPSVTPSAAKDPAILSSANVRRSTALQFVVTIPIDSSWTPQYLGYIIRYWALPGVRPLRY